MVELFDVLEFGTADCSTGELEALKSQLEDGLDIVENALDKRQAQEECDHLMFDPTEA